MRPYAHTPMPPCRQGQSGTGGGVGDFVSGGGRVSGHPPSRLGSGSGFRLRLRVRVGVKVTVTVSSHPPSGLICLKILFAITTSACTHTPFRTLHPAPCTLHPTPYTLHPTPWCTLHPTPYTTRSATTLPQYLTGGDNVKGFGKTFRMVGQSIPGVVTLGV